MPTWEKFRRSILAGQSDHNIGFNDLCKYVAALGFTERTVGSHHVFVKHGVVEIINLQPDENNRSKAKAYQVRQIRNLILKYGLAQDERRGEN